MKFNMKTNLNKLKTISYFKDPKKLYKNWTVHNIIGHPLMGILKLSGFSNIAKYVHDETCPEQPQSHQQDTNEI